jgi:cysteinyl-tRNA synthetase
MSKSLGNLVTIHQFLEENEADVFRLIVLNGSYRGPLTFTDDVVEQARKALVRLRSALKPAAGGEASADAVDAAVAGARTAFQAAMDDDFNTAGALAALFELVRAINQARDAGSAAAGIQAAQGALLELGRVLGLLFETEVHGDEAIDPFVDLLLEVRRELRREKLWVLSDLVRDRLKALGIVVEDSKDGSIWFRE